MSVQNSRLIFFVRDQAASAKFYSAVLDKSPVLDVPGMTEFELGEGVFLGIMPETGINRILDDTIVDISLEKRSARAELYLTVDDAKSYHSRSLSMGARELSPYGLRNWGDYVAYSADLDGHVLAFAQGGSDKTK